MMQSSTQASAGVVRVNDVVFDAESIAQESLHHANAPDPLAAASYALAIRELLRQRAVELELLPDGAVLDDACTDALFDRELSLPAPTQDACERYYRNHAAQFRRNDIVYASHILFAVTEGAPVALILKKAEQTLLQVKAEPDTFEAVARELSNCPSGGVGGSLGQLLRGDSVPEFERAIFDTTDSGLLPRVVKTRFGFHIVRIDQRVPGEALPFEAAQDSIAQFLEQRVRHKAMQQYVSILAARAQIEGVDLGQTDGPLIQ